MANLNHIEQLIQDLCPSGVDYSTLGEACYILDSKRKPVSKNARQKGKYPYYGANGILDYVSGYIKSINTKNSKVEFLIYSDQNIIVNYFHCCCWFNSQHL